MSTQLIINTSLPETRIALLENGEIQELLIEREGDKGSVGNIYKGRVTRVLPGMQAAFVDIGLEKAAFLYVDDVYVHSEILEEAEKLAAEGEGESSSESLGATVETEISEAESTPDSSESTPPVTESSATSESDLPIDEDSDDDDGDDEGEPVAMGPAPGDSDEEDTIGNRVKTAEEPKSDFRQPRRPYHSQRGRRGRKHGGGYRRRKENPVESPTEAVHEVVATQLAEGSTFDSSDRSTVSALDGQPESSIENQVAEERAKLESTGGENRGLRPEFREQRGRDRKIRPRSSMRMSRPQVNIQDLLKEGQEVLVQVAKDAIATKGARLTCHISLPGRHLVCMPTIDHVGVSRRIERDDERRRLRDFVERNRPKKLGFIVRTASAQGRGQSERGVKQDIEYLTNTWEEIRTRAAEVNAPALVYSDLNSVLRSIRDWVTEEIDRIVVDSRYHYNDILNFVAHFMPSIKSKVELYQGDVPIFDSFGITTELTRALDRKVWLKSGGYIVIDQAEALVAIDVNTGRYVGKKNLEDTILKTNLEAVEEIAYQLRLRNCGGIIVLDFIDMEKDENRHRVYRALEEELKKDRARPAIQKISDLGLIEMTRKRTRDTMVRTMCESCVHCEGRGYVKTKQTIAYEVLREIERVGSERDISRILVQAHADVIDVLATEERETLDQLERRYRKQIYLQAIPEYHQEQFDVSTDLRPSTQRGRDRFAMYTQKGSEDQRRDRRRGRDRVRSSFRGPTELQAPQVEQAIEPTHTETDSAPKVIIQESPIVIVSPKVQENLGHGDFESEEDRLAYLRAQATQDAALQRQLSEQAGSAITTRTTAVNTSGTHRRNHRHQNQRGHHHTQGHRGRHGGGRYRHNQDQGRRGGSGSGGRYSQTGQQPQGLTAASSTTPVTPQAISTSPPDSDDGDFGRT